MKLNTVIHKTVRSWTSGQSDDWFLIHENQKFYLFRNGEQTLAEPMTAAASNDDAIELLMHFGFFKIQTNATTYLTSNLTWPTNEFLSLFELAPVNSDPTENLFTTREDETLLSRASGFGAREDTIVRVNGNDFLAAESTQGDLLLFSIRNYGEIHYAGTATISVRKIIGEFQPELIELETSLFSAIGLGNYSGSNLTKYARDVLVRGSTAYTRFRSIEGEFEELDRYATWIDSAITDWWINKRELDLGSEISEQMRSALAEFLRTEDAHKYPESWWHWADGSYYCQTDPIYTPVELTEFAFDDKGTTIGVATAAYEFSVMPLVAEFLTLPASHELLLEGLIRDVAFKPVEVDYYGEKPFGRLILLENSNQSQKWIYSPNNEAEPDQVYEGNFFKVFKDLALPRTALTISLVSTPIENQLAEFRRAFTFRFKGNIIDQVFLAGELIDTQSPVWALQFPGITTSCDICKTRLGI